MSTWSKHVVDAISLSVSIPFAWVEVVVHAVVVGPQSGPEPAVYGVGNFLAKSSAKLFEIAILLFNKDFSAFVADCQSSCVIDIDIFWALDLVSWLAKVAIADIEFSDTAMTVTTFLNYIGLAFSWSDRIKLVVIRDFVKGVSILDPGFKPGIKDDCSTGLIVDGEVPNCTWLTGDTIKFWGVSVVPVDLVGKISRKDLAICVDINVVDHGLPETDPWCALRWDLDTPSRKC